MKRDLNISLATKMQKIRPAYIFLPKLSAYRTDFHETKYMSFLMKDIELLEFYNLILHWNLGNSCIKSSIKKEFDSWLE